MKSPMRFLRAFRLLIPLVLLVATSAGATPSARERATLIERSRLTKSVVHYVYEVPLGNEPFDAIQVHRVVKVEHDGRGRRRHRPADPEHAVFLIHGSAGLFSTAFLAGALPSADSDEQSMAVFLAERGIDVWGVDLAWSLVPFDQQDLSFMADWGLQRQVDEVSIALDVATSTRGKRKHLCRLKHRRGHWHDGVHLLGYSLGGVIGYAVVNSEANLPCRQRRVKGWIPFDTSVSSENPAAIARACEAADATDLLLTDGILRDESNGFAVLAAALAQTDPGGASPFAPGLTNEQFALVVFALPSPQPPGADNPAYHLFGGVFDTQTGLPFDLTYVTTPFAVEWLGSFGGGAPLKTLSDAAHLVCGDIDSPFDDAFSDVRIPVRYVGADGGFGASGIHSTTLLGSSDVTSDVVDLDPNDLLDFGHIDLATAPSAGFLAWENLADWIREHDGGVCEAGPPRRR